MKHLFLLCAGLFLSVFVHAQAAKYDNNNSVKTQGPVANPDKLIVNLTDENLFIVYKNQEIPAANIRALDSLLKKVPIREHLSVEFKSLNARLEKMRSIDTVLRQCHCQITRISQSFNKQ